MSTIDEIKHKVSAMSEHERAELLDFLLEEPGTYESKWEKRWLDVAESRAKSLADGAVSPVPDAIVEKFFSCS